MIYQVTARYGARHQRYVTLSVEAEDMAAALILVAGRLPKDVLEEIDLVEARLAVDPEGRSYVGDAPAGGP